MRRFAKSVYGSYRTAGSNPALSVQYSLPNKGRLFLYPDSPKEPALAAQQTISGYDAEGAAQRIPSTAWRLDWHREIVEVLVCILGIWMHGAAQRIPSTASTAWRLSFPARQAVGSSL